MNFTRRVWSLVVITIRKFIYEELLPAKYTESKAQKSFKSIYLVLFTYQREKNMFYNIKKCTFVKIRLYILIKTHTRVRKYLCIPEENINFAPAFESKCYDSALKTLKIVHFAKYS